MLDAMYAKIWMEALYVYISAKVWMQTMIFFASLKNFFWKDLLNMQRVVFFI